MSEGKRVVAGEVILSGLATIERSRKQMFEVGVGAAIRLGRQLTLIIGKFCRLFEYFHKHLARELSGLRVLIRRMVRGQ